MSTPCNSLNVQLIKVSSLASYSSIKNADLMMIVENTNGSKYSRQSTLSDLRNYTLNGGFSSFPATSFYSQVDGNILSTYTAGNTILFSHGLSSVPTLVRVVLKCNNNDGNFIINNELEITSCYNNNNKQPCFVLSDVSNISLIIPTFSSIKTYTNSSPPTEYSLNLNNWSFKVYAWK